MTPKSVFLKKISLKKEYFDKHTYFQILILICMALNTLLTQTFVMLFFSYLPGLQWFYFLFNIRTLVLDLPYHRLRFGFTLILISWTRLVGWSREFSAAVLKVCSGLAHHSQPSPSLHLRIMFSYSTRPCIS